LKNTNDRKTKLKPTTDGTGRDLKNLKVYELAASGATQQEIGNQVGLSRQQINTILNSEEARSFVESGRSILIESITEAARKMVDLLGSTDEKIVLQAATTILKGSGVLTEKIELAGDKPFIVQFINGEEIHLGIKATKGDT
jgi:hypothetical protein